MTVSEIMMRRFSALASVVETDDLRTVADKLALHGLGAVVVLSPAGGLAGMISDGDLVGRCLPVAPSSMRCRPVTS